MCAQTTVCRYMGLYKIEEVVRRVQRKIKCRSKMTEKHRSRKRNLKKPKSGKVQEKQITGEVYSKIVVWLE